MVFTEPGTYTWYVRSAAETNQRDSFFGPSQDADTANPVVAPSGGISRFGVSAEMKDAEGNNGIATTWDWLRSDPAASGGFVEFEQVVVTQADVDNQQIFSLEFAPRQPGATLDKMVLVQTPAFTNITDSDLDVVAENATGQFEVAAAKLLVFEVGGDLTLNDGSMLSIDIRAENDWNSVNVTGTATVDGIFSVTLDDFTPNLNDTLTILTAGTLIDNEPVLGGPDGSAFSLSTLNNQVVLTFEGSTTLVGDYSDNGQVEQADLDLVLLNWGGSVPPSPEGWINDPPTPDQVDQDDLDRVLLNWGNTTTAANAAVPEPATWVLLGMTLLFVCRRR